MNQRINVLGLPFDGGISAMQHLGRGTTGASKGPYAIVDNLIQNGGLDSLGDDRCLYLPDLEGYNSVVTPNKAFDPEFIARQKRQLERAHRKIMEAARKRCRDAFLLSLGGDHSITCPLVKGVREGHDGIKLGIINVDAHFDMRALEESNGVKVISSGNPFRRLIESGEVDPHNVVELGIMRSNSEVFRALKEYAEGVGATVVYIDELKKNIAEAVVRAVSVAGNGTDGIYLSVDMDVADKSVAPGVSAPADGGLNREELLKLVGGIREQAREKLVAADVVEISQRILDPRGANEGLSDLDKEQGLVALEMTADLGREVAQRIVA